eukprot:scaffold528_cov165-Amphora_coffeaeformis.AAC.27
MVLKRPSIRHVWWSLWTAATVLDSVQSFVPRRALDIGNSRREHLLCGLTTTNHPAHSPCLNMMQSTKLWQSAAVETMEEASNQTSASSSAQESEEHQEAAKESMVKSKPKQKYDLPWSHNQEWAMKDNLSKYTVQVHIQEDGKDKLHMYTLWRTLSNEVTALSGYPLKFLVDRYQDMRDEFEIQTSPEVLPYLDGFSFESDGGVSGRVYGIAGVAEGTRIQTTPVAGVESTLQKGYILTQEGIVYELGLPSSETKVLDGQMKMAQRAASSIQSAASDVELADVAENNELVKLGALTAVLLSGAWAVETLSHHLTVNVFWV